jgi:hypothetical protein
MRAPQTRPQSPSGLCQVGAWRIGGVW